MDTTSAVNDTSCTAYRTLDSLRVGFLFALYMQILVEGDGIEPVVTVVIAVRRIVERDTLDILERLAVECGDVLMDLEVRIIKLEFYKLRVVHILRHI